MARSRESSHVKAPGVGFVHLRAHSSYSLLEGALHINKLADLCVKDRMPALAIADSNNLFGALEFSETLSSQGVQPIIGITILVDDQTYNPSHDQSSNFGEKTEPKLSQIVLLAKSLLGYENLLKLNSKAYLESDTSFQPHVSAEDIRMFSDDLIALTGGPDGPLNKELMQGQSDHAKNILAELLNIFEDRLYVEVQRHDMPGEQQTESALLALAYEMKVPIVATNQPYFARSEDFEAHDALICIASSEVVASENRRRLSPEHYFKTRQEMATLFADLPEAINNTIEIARRCAFRPKPRAPILPNFTTLSDKGEEIDHSEDESLKELSLKGLKERLQANGTADGLSEKDYYDRLEFELEVITRMKYSGYFLIVADFISWSKRNNIPVGPGRGSGAGSVVAWALTITDLDPLRFGLLFERFLNPERVSMPDFDIDFCQDRRDDVIEYVQEKYGKDQVAQIITFGKLQARAVLRDVGRVLQLPYSQVDRICKMIPNNPANPMSLAQAIDAEERIRLERDQDPAVAQMLKIGLKLEGLYRHASTHAAGVVIGDRPLNELVPLYRDPRSDMPVTQFNMKWVENAGLVKFDFLGLKTLTVIQETLELIRHKEAELDLSSADLNDPATYKMLSKGDTVGIFQLESSGMRDVLRKSHPDRFEDIIALVALYRPGPMDNIPKFIACKRGLEEPDYLHPKLETLLTETYGVIIYQEQVMQIAQILSGYSLGEADLLRRAMGKKIQAEMDKQKQRFVEGAVERDVERKKAENIFELVNKFAGYGFNKSHAAAYALVAFHTAYLKAHHVVEFIASSMSLDMINTDKLYVFKQDADDHDFSVLPPCVNHSGVKFTVEDGNIRYALAAIKNVGSAAMEELVEIRREDGPFTSLTDFASRINPRAINKRALENLIRAGALDCLDKNRARLMKSIELILSHAQRAHADKKLGQNDLFGGAGGADRELRLPEMKNWLPMEKLAQEFDAIGFYLSGHPLDEYISGLKACKISDWSTFSADVHAHRVSAARLAGTVTSFVEKISQRGNRYAFVGFSDPSGQFEAVIFSEQLSMFETLFEPGAALVVTVEADLKGDDLSVRIRSAENIDKVLSNVAAGLKITIADDGALDEIKTHLEPGASHVSLIALANKGLKEVEIALPGKFDITPNIKGELREVGGVIDVQDV